MTNFITDDLINANVRVKYSGASASITNATIAIDFDTPVYNEGFENISAGEFTIPVDGQYQIQLGLELTGSSNGTALVYVDGVEADVGGTNQNLARHRCSSVLNLTKGQTVSGRFPNTSSLTGSSNLNYLAITRIAQYSAGEPAGFALATATKAGLITNYETVTLNLDNDFSNGVIRCERINKTITISQVNSAFGASHANGTSAETSSGFIPAQFRPTASEIVNLYHMESTNVARVRIEPDGTLSTNYIGWGGSDFFRADTGSAFTITFTRDE